jgi:amino acid adenylation domain-containing protein
LLRWRALNQPDHLAYTFLADGETPEIGWTYRELDRRAQAIASEIERLSETGQRALLLYPPGLEFIAALFGCFYAGVTAAPAYPPDPSRISRTLPRLLAIQQDLSPAVILSTAAVIRAGASLFALPQLQSSGLLATDSLEPTNNYQPRTCDPGDAVFIQYTSGSTGSPKGVVLTNANLLHNAALVHSAVEHSDGDSYVSWLPTFHDMGLMAGVIQPLFAGIPAVLMPPSAFLEKPIRWLRAISRYRATTSGGPNFAYELCVRKITESACADLDLSSWTVAFNGAEPVRKDTVERFTEAFSRFGFRREVFYPCYGLAEATLIVSGGTKTSPPALAAVQASGIERNRVILSSNPAEATRTSVSCGRALGDQKVIIVDSERETECEPGDVGEIWVSGPSVARGYWNRTEESRQTFEASLRDTGDGPFLKTGDLGFIQDGQLFIAGRLKDLIIIRGLNHHPQDIETSVERSHPLLRAGCSAAFAIDAGGEEVLAVVSEIDSAGSPDSSALQAIINAICHAIAREHEITVHDVALIKPGNLPKTSSGKVRRSACRAALIQQQLEVVARWSLPRAGEFLTASENAPARKEPGVPEWLSRALAQVGINASSLGSNEPLIRRGLDSLAAVELASRIQEETGVQVSPVSLLQGAAMADIARQVNEAERVPADAEEIDRSRRSEAATPHPDEAPKDFPLSYGQRGLWFLHQFAPGNAAYKIVRAVRLSGALNVVALRQAVETLVDRHDMLRATFHNINGSPVQRIQPRAAASFDFEDASGLSDAGMNARLTEIADQPFDLEQSSLFKLTLFRRTDQEHVILLSVHHIIIDFWSLAIIVDELGRLYESTVSGTAAQLSPPAASYNDFVEFQAAMIESADGRRHRDYWHSQLAGDLPAVALPSNRPPQKTQAFQGGSWPFAVDSELADGLKSLAASNDATLHATLLACLQALIHRYTQQSDILIGSPAACRTRADWGGIVGYFVNPVVMRASVSSRQTFITLLGQSRDKLISALEHQDYPFALLVEELAPPRDLSQPPLFQIMLVLEKSHRLNEEGLPAFSLGGGGARMKLGGLDLESVNLAVRAAQLDLSFIVAEARGGLTAAIEYNAALFDASTVGRIAAHLKSVIRGVVSDASRSVAELPLLTAAEQSQLLDEWNNTEAVFIERQALHQEFERQVQQTRDRIAVSFEDDSITYEELNKRANQLARHLLALGVGPETRVGICVERSTDMVIVLLAVLKAGGAYVPLDPKYPAERLGFQISDAGVQVLVAQERTMPAAAGADVRILNLDAQRDAIAVHSSTDPGTSISRWNLAYVIYTSGSTGRPKGVAIDHNSALTFLAWARRTFSAQSLAGVLASTSICFDLSVFELFVPLSCGGTVVVVENILQAPNCEWAHQITLINTVPSAAAGLLRLGGIPRSVTTVNLAGEPLSATLAEQLFQHANIKQVINLYGPTEDTTYSTIENVERGASEPPAIGRPIANTRIYILDRHLNPLPAAVTGDLFISGDCLARGYLNRAGLTAEKFTPDPFTSGPGSRMYGTGDKARFREDGRVQFLGRADRQVKLRGFRIELEEIEHLMRSHESVGEAACRLIQDSAGEGRLVAYAAVDRGPDRQAAQKIKSFLSQHLPEYMVPSVVVPLEALPLTPNGKIDRKALPAPERDAGRPKYGLTRPLSLPEELLAAAWSDVLGVERVASDDNFFDLGGHSLLATRLASRVRNIFGVELPLQAIFQKPALSEQAATIERLMRRRTPSREPVRKPVLDRQVLPLSHAQRRLWLVDQREPGNNAYNIPAVVRLEGPLNPAVLHCSLSEVVRRQDSLRTCFPSSLGHPVQLVAERMDVVVTLVDLTSLRRSQAEVVATGIVREEASTGFDLSVLPLFRFRLVKLSATEHLLVMIMHHIISDGWSLGVFVSELAAIYNAAVMGRPAQLPKLEIQYGGYSAWQHQSLEPRLGVELDHWRERLSGAPAPELPSDRPRTAAMSHRGASAYFVLDQDISSRLNDLALGSNATLFMVLLGAFHVLLSRHTGEHDITIGTPIANRNRADIEPLIGFFVNTLPIRVRGDANDTFQERLATVKESVLDAYAHQDAPFERIVETTRRGSASQPLFRVMFVLQNAPLPELSLRGLRATRIDVESASAKFEITFSLEAAGRGLKGTVEYSADLFESSTINRMIEHFQTVLETVASDAQVNIGWIDLMRPSERRQVLEDWNRTSRDYGRVGSLQGLFEAKANKTPDRLAVISADGALSFRELRLRSNQLAHDLHVAGVGPETITGLFAERSLEMVIGILGILKAGGAYLPIDPSLPAERVRFMLDDARVGVVVTQESAAAATPGGRFEIKLSPEGLAARLRPSGECSESPDPGIDPDNLAYVLYTSGSTGWPKGVAVTHRSIWNHMHWFIEDCPVSEDDRVLQKTAFGFDASVWEFFAPLITGAQLVMASPGGHQETAYLINTIAEQSITIAQFVPSMLRLLLDENGFEDCESLKVVYCGGEPLSTDLQDKFHARSNGELRNLYGPTEGTIDVTSWRCGRTPESASIPIGRPISNTRAYILDTWLQPVAIGVVAELHIAGECLSRGYVGRPELTAAAFIPDPFGGSEGARLYRTGDLARSLSDGSIDYQGRIDHQLRIRGFRVEIGEIDAALARHPHLREAAVTAQERQPGGPVLVAYIVPVGDRAPDAADLRSHLKTYLPDYMMPAIFVSLKALPKTTHGKIDRRALPEPDWEADTSVPFVPPETPTQRLIAETLAGLIGIVQVGLDENFFDLGGDSIIAARMAARLREACGVEMTIRSILEHPTVAELSRHVELMADAGGVMIRFGSGAPIPRANRTMTGPRATLLPMSYAQQRLWLIEQLDPGNSYYNIPAALRLRGDLNVQALRDSVNDVVARHEALRTSFPPVSAEPAQLVSGTLTTQIPVINLSDAPESIREASARKIATDDAARGFDLSRAPLFRFQLIKLSGSEHILVMVMHHIIADGWSLGVLAREFCALYDARVNRTRAELPVLGLQYGDYAAWQRNWLRGERLERELEYWRHELDGAPIALDLPADRRRPAALSHQGMTLPLDLDPALRVQLKQLAQAHNSTIFMVLLAGFYALLSRYSGQQDIVIGTPVANRDRAEIEPLIGFFVNTLPIRLKAERRDTFEALLERVKRKTLGAYAHQEAPFEKIMEAIRPARGISGHPLFQVMFALQNAPMPEIRFSGLDAEVEALDSATAKFDLSLLMSEAEDRLDAVFEYSTDLYERATVARFATHLERLLAGAVSDPLQRVRELPLLTPAEISQIVETEASLRFTGPLHHALEARALESIPGTHWYVLDSNMQPAPIGVVGDLYMSSLDASMGDSNRPDEGAEAFVPDSLARSPGARIYRTGHSGRYLPDGNIEVVELIDDVTHLRGLRVRPAEIEAAITLSPAVREVFVDVLPSTGLTAYVVTAQEQRLLTGELRSFLETKLPAYLIPSAFVFLDSLPLNERGEVDKERLPTSSVLVAAAEGSPMPAGDLEEALCSIWSRVLGIERVGLNDNFFGLGGHSLLATRAVAEIRDSLNVAVPLRKMFEAPTIAALAAYIKQQRVDGATIQVRNSSAGRPGPISEPPDESFELPPVRANAAGREFPLSFSQQRLWLLNQLDSGSPAHNIPAVLMLEGSLDVSALQRSLNDVARRHETLRTGFGWSAGGPVQIIAGSLEIELQFVDLSETLSDGDQNRAARMAEAEAAAPFDLARPPLFRVKLVRLSTHRHLLIITLHRIISDDWSLALLISELGLLYEALANDKPLPFAEPALQYRDVAVWEREWLRDGAPERDLQYWRGQLAGIAPMELPTDRPRPQHPGYRGSRERLELSPALTKSLKEMSRRQGVTPFILSLVAFKVLLSRYSGEEDIAAGVEAANRTREDLSALIGPLANRLILRSQVKRRERIRELITTERELALSAHAHQAVPFEALVEQLELERNDNLAELLRVTFECRDDRASLPEWPGLRAMRIDPELTWSRFDLAMSLVETETGLLAGLEFNSELFDRERIKTMLAHYRNLLASIAAKPDQRVEQIELLSESERRQLLVEWNRTRSDYPDQSGIAAIFEEWAHRTPEKAALVFAALDANVLTYRELNSRADRLASRLKRAGVHIETPVAICAERSIELIIGLLGIVKAGGTYVPLDPDEPEERLAFMLDDTRAATVLTQRKFTGLFNRRAPAVLSLDLEPDNLNGAGGFGESRVEPDNLTYVMYTSGSTGAARGVSITHRGISRLVRNAGYANLTAGDVFLQLAPISFDASTFEIWGSLLNGATLVLAPPSPSTPRELGRILQRYQVSMLWLTAGLFHLMVDEQLEALRVPQLLAGGDVLSVAHVKRYLDFQNGCTLVNGYGPTENTTFTCCHAMTGALDVDHSVPIGRPISGTRVYVADPDVNLLPAGVTGELLIAGAGLARGYHNQSDLTAERFIPDPFSHLEGGRVYKSGDLVRYLRDGRIRFEGRADRLAKIRGFRIELDGVENLIQTHQSVAEAACKIFEDPMGEKQLVAYVTLNRDAGVDPEEVIKAYMREHVPAYMIPAVVVPMNQLPLTPNGKVDRNALPHPGARPKGLDYIAPRTATEEAIARIWSEVLGVERIGVQDSFFDLGGHSLMAARVVSKVQEALGVETPLRALFESSTVAEFSARLDSSRAEITPSDLPELLPAAIEQYRAAVVEGQLELSAGLKEKLLRT